MAENGKTWLRLRWRTMFLLATLAVVGWSGYSYWAEYRELADRKAPEMMAPAVGATCEIQLQASDAPVTGKFVKLNDDWIVLVTEQEGQVWIPREHVRLMRVEPR